MKPHLIIINQAQFGYHIDTYYYCKYMQGHYKIIYIGRDHGLEKIDMSGVKIINIKSNKKNLHLNFLKEVLKHTKSAKSIIFIKYFKGINTLIRILRPHNKQILDIRTSSIDPNIIKRFLNDTILKIESFLFKNITIISKSLACKLKLQSRSYILPLGADILSETDKKFDTLRLLYVGTLHNRNIHKTIEGFTKFLRANSKNSKTHYTIIGTGFKKEVDQLKKIVEANKLQNYVHILGRIPHNQIKKYFDSHNVGVAYIPITPYFNFQPPTKTFEYVLSGLAVIGTATYENKLVINQTNGILTGDSAEDFCNGLQILNLKLNSFKSKAIRNQSLQYEWQNITNNLNNHLKTLSK